MKKLKRYSYPAVFTYEPDQEIAVVFPDLDVATSGMSDDDALISARELLGCVLYALEMDGERIPAPSSLAQVQAAENERTALIDVYMPSIRKETFALKPRTWHDIEEEDPSLDEIAAFEQYRAEKMQDI